MTEQVCYRPTLSVGQRWRVDGTDYAIKACNPGMKAVCVRADQWPLGLEVNISQKRFNGPDADAGYVGEMPSMLAALAQQQSDKADGFIPVTVAGMVPQTAVKPQRGLMRSLVATFAFLSFGSLALVGLATVAAVGALAWKFVTLDQINQGIEVAMDNLSAGMSALGITGAIASAKVARPYAMAALRGWIADIVRSQVN